MVSGVFPSPNTIATAYWIGANYQWVGGARQIITILMVSTDLLSRMCTHVSLTEETVAVPWDSGKRDQPLFTIMLVVSTRTSNRADKKSEKGRKMQGE